MFIIIFTLNCFWFYECKPFACPNVQPQICWIRMSWLYPSMQVLWRVKSYLQMESSLYPVNNQLSNITYYYLRLPCLQHSEVIFHYISLTITMYLMVHSVSPPLSKGGTQKFWVGGNQKGEGIFSKIKGGNPTF